jgi:lipid A disaccharide synthetase
MSELYVEPEVLADAGRSLAADRSVLADVADALSPALGVIVSALPGSRTAEVAGRTAAALTSATRAAAAELDQLARAVTTAAHDYRVVERATAAGIERDGRAPV